MITELHCGLASVIAVSQSTATLLILAMILGVAALGHSIRYMIYRKELRKFLLGKTESKWHSLSIQAEPFTVPLSSENRVREIIRAFLAQRAIRQWVEASHGYCGFSWREPIKVVVLLSPDIQSDALRVACTVYESTLQKWIPGVSRWFIRRRMQETLRAFVDTVAALA